MTLFVDRLAAGLGWRHRQPPAIQRRDAVIKTLAAQLSVDLAVEVADHLRRRACRCVKADHRVGVEVLRARFLDGDALDSGLKRQPFRYLQHPHQ